jgi:hypothetical protein
MREARVNSPVLLESSASIRILGKNLDFDSVSTGLSVKPSHMHRAGDQGLTRKPYSSDAWLFESPLARSESLNRHLDWMRAKLLPHYDFLRLLRKRGEVTQVSIFCGLTAEAFECSFALVPSALRLSSELDIEMELSFIFHDPTDSWKNTATIEAEVEASNAGPTAYRKESKAYLRVVGSKLGGAELSRTLELQQLEENSLDQWDSSGKQNRGNESFLAAPFPITQPIDAHLKSLGNALSSHSDIISSLKHQAEISIVCNLSTECGWESFSLSPEALRYPAELELPLQFNVKLT